MKYRLIKEVNNAANGSITYIIEKHVRFIFFSWWSRHYLLIEGCYEFYKEQEALNMLNILNGKKEWISKSVIA